MQPRDLTTLILKEVVDNALDAGATDVTLSTGWRGSILEYIVADDGAGIEPSVVPKLFSVNRPLLLTKLRRLPLRGMLGNGLRVVAGAVAASQGSLVVETRGHRPVLHIDDVTGLTTIATDEPVPPVPGTVVRVALGNGLRFAATNICSYSRQSILHAWRNPMAARRRRTGFRRKGFTGYFNASSPRRQRYERLSPISVSASMMIAAHATLGRDDAAKVLAQLQGTSPPVAAEALGHIGAKAFGNSYAIKTGVAAIGGTQIPFVIEAWAVCSRGEVRGQGKAEIALWLNRSPSFGEIANAIYGDDLIIRGCGIHQRVGGVAAGNSSIILSIIVPFVELAGDGKTPALSLFRGTIVEGCRQGGASRNGSSARCHVDQGGGLSGNGTGPTPRPATTAACQRMLDRSCMLPVRKSSH